MTFPFCSISLSKPYSCLPYLGTKRTLAPELFKAILSRHPKATHFYDLFGGGGAMSFYAIKNFPQFKTVHYNEYDPAITSFMSFLQTWFSGQPTEWTRWNDAPLPREFYEWLPRHDFKKNKEFPTIQGGLARLVWSYSHTQNYLYPDDVVPYKRLSHNYLVSGEGKEELEEFLGLELPITMHRQPLEQRRLHLKRFLSKNPTKAPVPASALAADAFFKQFHALERLRHISCCSDVVKFSALTNQSYCDVEILDRPETVIYVDPPYQNTGHDTYKFGSAELDYEAFYNWCENCPFPLFISGYEAPAKFSTVLEIQVAVTLASFTGAKERRKHAQRVEKLFWNGR